MCSQPSATTLNFFYYLCGMNRIITIILTALLMLVMLVEAGCTASDEKAQQEADRQEADQMSGKLPDPATAGRTEARKFLNRTWTDSLQLHSQLLEVKAMESRYRLEGSKEQATQFDSVFISTLRTVDPALAAEIGPALNKK